MKRPSDGMAPELLADLGRLVLLPFFLKADPGGLRIVSQQASASAVTDWIGQAVRQRGKDQPQPRDQILKLLQRIDELRAKRNDLVHGQWFVQKRSNEVHIDAHKPRRRSRDDPFPARPALDILLKDVRAVLGDLVRLVGAYRLR